MDKTNTAKLVKKLSDQLTKDFAKTVKSLTKSVVAGGDANMAFVLGYMDASCGNAKRSSGIPKRNEADYAKGWQAGRKKTPTKAKD